MGIVIKESLEATKELLLEHYILKQYESEFSVNQESNEIRIEPLNRIGESVFLAIRIQLNKKESTKMYGIMVEPSAMHERMRIIIF